MLFLLFARFVSLNWKNPPTSSMYRVFLEPIVNVYNTWYTIQHTRYTTFSCIVYTTWSIQTQLWWYIIRSIDELYQRQRERERERVHTSSLVSAPASTTSPPSIASVRCTWLLLARSSLISSSSARRERSEVRPRSTSRSAMEAEGDIEVRLPVRAWHQVGNESNAWE